MAAAMILRQRLGSSLVDASARVGLGGSVGAIVTRRSSVVLHPSGTSLTEVATARPGLGGCIGAYMGKRARVAAASYVTTGARGIARVGSGASGFRSVGSGPALLRHGALVGSPRAGMLVPTRAFSKRTKKDAFISFIVKYFGIEKVKLSKCIEAFISFIVKYFGIVKVKLSKCIDAFFTFIGNYFVIWETNWQNFRHNLSVDLMIVRFMGEACMVVFDIWKERWLLWLKIYGAISFIGASVATYYSLNMSAYEFLGLLQYMHDVKSEELKTLVVAYRKHKKAAEGIEDSDIEDNPEMVLMDSYIAAVVAWKKAMAAAKTIGRVDALLSQEKDD